MKEVNVYRIQLENIFARAEDKNFSKEESASWVGGEKKLERLIADGKIAAYQKTPGGKWYCNARQVLENCRNMR